jgi:hypothetical protein
VNSEEMLLKEICADVRSRAATKTKNKKLNPKIGFCVV